MSSIYNGSDGYLIRILKCINTIDVNDSIKQLNFFYKKSATIMLINHVQVILFIVTQVAAVQFELGPCLLQYLEPCSDEVIQFYMFSSTRPNSAPVLLDPKNLTIPKWLNLNNSNKLIVHGYAGNLDFYATKTIRTGELNVNEYDLHKCGNETMSQMCHLSGSKRIR